MNEVLTVQKKKRQKQDAQGIFTTIYLFPPEKVFFSNFWRFWEEVRLGWETVWDTKRKLWMTPSLTFRDEDHVETKRILFLLLVTREKHSVNLKLLPLYPFSLPLTDWLKGKKEFPFPRGSLYFDSSLQQIWSPYFHLNLLIRSWDLYKFHFGAAHSYGQWFFCTQFDHLTDEKSIWITTEGLEIMYEFCFQLFSSERSRRTIYYMHVTLPRRCFGAE